MNKVIPKSGNKIEICSHSTNSLEQNNIRQQRISPVHDDGDDDDDDNDDMVTWLIWSVVSYMLVHKYLNFIHLGLFV